MALRLQPTPQILRVEARNEKELGTAFPCQPGVGQSNKVPFRCSTCKVRELAFCCVLNDAEIERFENILTHVKLSPRQTLFDEAEEATHAFNVTEGTLKLFKLLPDGRRQVIGFLNPGDFIGLADVQEYSCSAEAITDTLLCRFPRKKLEILLKKLPKLESRFFDMARNELLEAHQKMLLLGRMTAKERIASFLLMLSDRAACRGQPRNPIAIPMSRNDIGDFLGLTIETVSRTLTRLKGTGVISVENNRKIIVNDQDLLEEIAGRI